VARKALVTSLRECDNCGLRFRVPKDSSEAALRFYQAEYQQGFTTDCPSDEELQRLVSTGFRGNPNDYSFYIEVLHALGLRPGNRVLDFGCSWGYGSWQLRRAGFQVYSYEVSKPRAEYAAAKLGCHIISSLREIPEPVDCFFSAHVIEHLPNPNIMWEAIGQVLAERGVVVCFTPNGESHLEQIYGTKQYHRLWGKVHPLLLTRKAFEEMAARHGFVPDVFSARHSYRELAPLEKENRLDGSELLLVASRSSGSLPAAVR
jgi:SAM-dependent methyltransferase